MKHPDHTKFYYFFFLEFSIQTRKCDSIFGRCDNKNDLIETLVETYKYHCGNNLNLNYEEHLDLLTFVEIGNIRFGHKKDNGYFFFLFLFFFLSGFVPS